MSAPPAAPTPGSDASGGVLRELQTAATVKRAARQRIAEATATGADKLELDQHRAAHAVVTARWVRLLRTAAHDGHPMAVIARAAGVTAPAVYYRLATPAPSDGGCVAGKTGSGTST